MALPQQSSNRSGADAMDSVVARFVEVAAVVVVGWSH